MNSKQVRALAIVHKFFPDVTRVRDATRRLRLEVKARDATPRGRKKHQSCALAQACKRKLHLDGAIISVSRAYLVKGDVATRYELPPTIAREITSFDRGATFAPGVYELGKIQKNHTLGVPRGAKYGPKKTRRLKPKHITSGIRAALA